MPATPAPPPTAPQPAQQGPAYTIDSAVAESIENYDKELRAIGATPSTQAAAIHLAVARLLELAGQPDAAIARLKAALACNPDSISAMRELRRFARAAGHWDACLEGLTLEGDRVDHRPRRAALTEERARLLHSLGRNDEALEACQRALHLQPGALSTLELQRQIFAQQRAWSQVMAIIEEIADRCEDPRLEMSYRMLMAEIAEHNLHESAIAVTAYTRASALQPEHRAPVAGAERLFLRQERWQDLFNLLVKHSQAVQDLRQVHALSIRAGILASERLGDQQAAVQCLESAYAILPEDPLPLYLLLDVYQRSANAWRERDKTYIRLLGSSTDPKERAEWALARVDNLLTHHESKEPAIEVLIGLLEEQPHNGAALEKLRHLLWQVGRIDEYILLAWNAAERTTNITEAGERFYELGELCRQHEEHRAQALQCFERAIEVLPTHLGAFCSLETLLRANNDFARLAALYEKRLLTASDPDVEAGLAWTLAQIYDAHLHQAQEALRVLARYRNIRPKELGALWMQQRLLRATQAWQQVLTTLETEIDLCQDAPRRAALREQQAEILAETLKDPARALSLLEQALEEDPFRIALHRKRILLLQRVGQARELVEAYTAMLAIQPNQEKAEALVRIAHILERDLAEPREAIAAYEKALLADPHCVAAQDGLIRLHLAQRDWPRYREALVQRSTRALPPLRMAGELFRIGVLLNDRFGQAAEAEQVLTQSIGAVPAYAPAMQHLEQVYGQGGRWDALAHLLRNLLAGEKDPDTKAQAAYRLGVVCFRRLGNAEEALQPFEMALAVAPHLSGTRLNLACLLSELGQREEAATLFFELAGEVQDPNLAIALYQIVADIEDVELSLPFDQADVQGRRALAAILEKDPLNLIAIERLEGNQINRAGLADFWQRRLRFASKDEQVELRLSLAEVLSAKEPEQAHKLLIDAVAHADGHLPALRMAANATLIAQDYSTACALRENEAAILHHRESKVAAWLSAAQIARDHLADFNRAKQSLGQAQILAPERRDICEALIEMHTIAKQWEGVDKSMRVYTDALAPELRPPTLLQMATLREEKLQDLERAANVLEEVLSIDPTNLQALERLALVETKREHWFEATEAYQRLTRIAPENPANRDWMIAMARIQSDRMGQLDQAKATLEAQLLRTPDDLEALQLLARTHYDQGALPAAAENLETYLSLARGPDTIKARVQLAKIYRALERAEKARAQLRELVALIPSESSALEALLAWADKQNDAKTIVDLLEDFVNSSPSPTADATISVRVSLARLLAGKLNLRFEAERHAKLAATAAPHNLDAQLLAARLFLDPSESRRYTFAAVQLDPFNVEAYYLLARSFEAVDLHELFGRCQQVLAAFGEREPKVLQRAEEAARVVAPPTAPIGRDGILNYLQAPKMPDWGVELLYRAGPQAQIFVLPSIPTYACPDDHPARAQAFQCAALLGFPNLELMFTSAPEVAVALDHEKPQRLILGPRALPSSEAEIRYHIGLGLSHLMLGTSLLHLLDNRDFLRLLQGLLGLAHEGFGEAEVVRQLSSFLGRRNRKAVIEHAKLLDPRSLRLDLNEWRRANTLTARRTGLLMSRDIRGSLDGLLRSHGIIPTPTLGVKERIQALRQIPDAGDLLLFALSDPLTKARKHLGMAR